jgi:riboflavin kinase
MILKQSKNLDEINSVDPDLIGEKEWFFLYWIAHYKLMNNGKITTPELCKIIPISQQTISRRILELEEKKYLIRRSGSRGGDLELTPEAFSHLEKVFQNLQDIFSSKSSVEQFHGKLKTGMGEGAHYIKNKNYLKQFKSKLGFEPFFGTLNVQVKPEMYEFLDKQLKNFKQIIIQGFENGSRTYGDVVCYLVKIWPKDKPDYKIQGALLLIQRTSHKPFVCEFIAKKCLREHFPIEDDDEVFFEFKN